MKKSRKISNYLTNFHFLKTRTINHNIIQTDPNQYNSSRQCTFEALDEKKGAN